MMGPTTPDGHPEPLGSGEPEAAPPPTPFDRVAHPSDTTVHRAVGERRGVRRSVAAGLLLLAVGLGFLAGLVASDVVAVPDVLRSPSVVEAEREAELAALLEDIIGTEGVMLAFNDAVAAGLEGVQDQRTARTRISEAARAGTDELTALRPGIVARTGSRAVDELRTAYLPHLDSWIEYLAAVAEEPSLLFTRDEQQPYILRINATADAFREALEDLLAAEPSQVVADLAERILDDGFRGDVPDPSV